MRRRVAWTVVVATWMVAAGVSLEIARRTDVGPVVLRLTDEHGVHATDAGAVVASAAAAAGFTAALRPSIARGSGRGRRTGSPARRP